jgi:hypothetical protein
MMGTLMMLSVLRAEWWWCKRSHPSKSGAGILNFDLATIIGGCSSDTRHEEDDDGFDALSDDDDDDSERRRLDAEPWWKSHPPQAHQSFMVKSQKELVTPSTHSMAKSQKQLLAGDKQWKKKGSSPPQKAASSSGGGGGGVGSDGFFKGASGVRHGTAEWSAIDEAGQDGALLWPSSWSSPDKNGSSSSASVSAAAAFPHELETLCTPFAAWLTSSYVPRASRVGRAPVVCAMPPHQGLGDQMKGVMRCWAAALATQRPLVFSHGKSRSSWVWTDASMVAPLKALQELVDFNPKLGSGKGGGERVSGGKATTAKLGNNVNKQQLISRYAKFLEGMEGPARSTGGGKGGGGGIMKDGTASSKAAAAASPPPPPPPPTMTTMTARREIEQDFYGSQLSQLLPCSDGVSAVVGGVRPYHGYEPAIANVKRSANLSPQGCLS